MAVNYKELLADAARSQLRVAREQVTAEQAVLSLMTPPNTHPQIVSMLCEAAERMATVRLAAVDAARELASLYGRFELEPGDDPELWGELAEEPEATDGGE